jgi:hypothetical protein
VAKNENRSAAAASTTTALVPDGCVMAPRSGLSTSGASIREELPVDRVGDPSLEAAHGFHAGLAGGELASVVGAAWGVEPDLGGRGDVQHVAHLPVPGS